MENPLGETIHRLRKERGWSTSALARRSGVSSAEISRLENGQGKGPGWHTLLCLSQAFSMSVSELTADVPQEYNEDPILAQQAEGLLRGVEEGKISASRALDFMQDLGMLQKRTGHEVERNV